MVLSGLFYILFYVLFCVLQCVRRGGDGSVWTVLYSVLCSVLRSAVCSERWRWFCLDCSIFCSMFCSAFCSVFGEVEMVLSGLFYIMFYVLFCVLQCVRRGGDGSVWTVLYSVLCYVLRSAVCSERWRWFCLDCSIFCSMLCSAFCSVFGEVEMVLSGLFYILFYVMFCVLQCVRRGGDGSVWTVLYSVLCYVLRSTVCSERWKWFCRAWSCSTSSHCSTRTVSASSPSSASLTTTWTA